MEPVFARHTHRGNALILAVMALSLAVWPSLASASESDAIAALRAQLVALQQQLDRLEAHQADAERARNAAAQRVDKIEAAQATQGDPIKVKWEPAPSIKSPDGKFEMNIRGRIFVDSAFTSDKDGSPNVNSTELRAARIGVEGKAWKDIKYKFEADFAGNETTVKDAYLQWHGPLKVTVGQFKTPNSLEEQTSSRYISFMERAAFTDAFGFARRIGLGLGTSGKIWSATVGVYRGSAGSANKDEGSTVAGRVTVGPKLGAVQLHLGASFRHRKAGNDQSLFRYRQRPFVHLADRFINTGHIAGKDDFYGVEAAALLGPFSLQGEFGWLNADVGALAPSDPTFSGGYVSATWFLTGEHRPYHASKGAFGRPKVKNPVFEGGFGAFQLAVRYDTIDLSDKTFLGGKQDTYLVGLNWYLNRNTRLVVDYAHSDITNAFDVAANGPDGKNNVDALNLRAQVDW